MTQDAAYKVAERRIEAARQQKATELDLSVLGLTEIPEAIIHLSQLKTLNLSRNQIREIPEAIAKLSQLKTLDLSRNQLTEIPEAIASLSNLIALWLSGNQLTEIPEVIAHLSQLKTLDLSENQLTEIPEAIADLFQLEELYLYNNQLTEIPEVIAHLSQLQALSLSNNQLTEIPEAISHFSQLQSLSLDGNQLTEIPEAISHLSQLQVIDLSNNQLTEIPEAISHLSQLQAIDLRDNQITEIPEAIAHLSQLQYLYLNRNPLNPDLKAAYDQGLNAVKEYLRAKAEGEVALNEAKLILVGEGEVGKSCLLGALRGDEWVEGRPTTHGIEIKPLVVTAPDETTEITLNGWDFGGQQVYRPTHQLFFSASALYLVVWKPREGPQQGFVKEWITLIKHREPDAKILIVATHGGPGQRQPDIDRQELIDLFGSDTILGFHFIDSKTNKGIPELRTAISQVAATLPNIGHTVPTKWQNVRDILQTSPQPYESYDDVMNLCAEQDMDAPQAELFIQISARSGLLTHYHYDTILRDIVILKPDWLAKAISYVFDDETTRKRSGLVDFDHLSNLWQNPPFKDETGYPKELHPIFLQLMERFDLSYKVILDPASRKPSNTSLIAQLVPDNRPEHLPDWGTEPTSGDRQQIQICRIVDERGQSANAEGLFYQLIVRLHKYSLGRENYNNSIHWQRGLMLDNDYNGRALLEHSGNDVRITVRAAYPERFLSYLTEEVKWLIESFWEGLNCNVMVPCITPCGLNLPSHGLFEVQKLIESKKKNRSEYPCSVSGCEEWQNIDQLLNNVPTAPPPSQDVGIEKLLIEVKRIRQDLAVKDRRDQQRYQNLSQQQRETLSRIDQAFANLMQTYLDEAKEGPRLFSFKPIDPSFFDKPKWLSSKFQLTLWCEHSRQPLPTLNPDNPKKGVYELELNREWFTKATPYFKLLTKTLSLVSPVAISATQFILDDATYASISEELNLGEKSLDFGIKSSNLAINKLEKQDSAEFPEGEAIRAKGAILRDLHRLLKEKDPSFGGLVRVQNKRREVLWVHEKFVSEY